MVFGRYTKTGRLKDFKKGTVNRGYTFIFFTLEFLSIYIVNKNNSFYRNRTPSCQDQS